MKSDLKKVAAAGLAVVRYLEAENEMRGKTEQAELFRVTEESVPAGPVSGSLWAASGRLSVMLIRNLMQYRVFQRV